MKTSQFAHELAQSPINLPRMALLFAQNIAYPTLDVTTYMEELQALSEGAQTAVFPDAPTALKAEQLAHYLFQETGFQGNDEAYHDPNNSYLNRVLDNYIGIPITLSVIYIHIAQQIGLPAYGISLPGHFIVGIKAKYQRLLFDPFHGGKRLTHGDCRQLVKQTTGYNGPFRPHWLEPTTPRAILARMLNNLRWVYIQEAQWQRAVTVMEHLQTVEFDVPEHVRDLGLVHYRHGNLRLAAHYLNQYTQLNPHSPDVATLKEGLQETLDEWVRSN